MPFAGREGGGRVHWHEHIDPKDPLLLFPPRKKKIKRFGTRHHQRLKFILCFFGSRFRFYFFFFHQMNPPTHPLGYLSINIDQHCVVHSLMEGEGHLKNSCFLVPCVQPKLIWNFIIFSSHFNFLSTWIMKQTNKTTAGGLRSAIELWLESGRLRSVRRRWIDLRRQQRRPRRRLPMGIRPPSLHLHCVLRRR